MLVLNTGQGYFLVKGATLDTSFPFWGFLPGLWEAALRSREMEISTDSFLMLWLQADEVMKVL